MEGSSLKHCKLNFLTFKIHKTGVWGADSQYKFWKHYRRHSNPEGFNFTELLLYSKICKSFNSICRLSDPHFSSLHLPFLSHRSLQTNWRKRCISSYQSLMNLDLKMEYCPEKRNYPVRGKNFGRKTLFFFFFSVPLFALVNKQFFQIDILKLTIYIYASFQIQHGEHFFSDFKVNKMYGIN